MTAILAAFRLQLQLLRGNRDYYIDLVRTPLLAATFLAIVSYGDRPDLLGHAVLAPVLMAMWSMSLLASGEIVDADRRQGLLEPLVATPAPFTGLVVGRIAAVTIVSLVALVETWAVAWLAFGAAVPVRHPLVFAVALLATAAAMSGTALLMAGLFVATRTARTFQNSLSYPFFLLGGVLVPVVLLPGWLQPVSRLVFLSWGSDLLRDSLGPAAVQQVTLRLGVILLLGTAGFLLGRWLLHRILGRARSTGSLSLT
jgi:ABC-2 type transport system permease protein